MILTYSETSFKGWQKLNSTQERIEYLFDSYVQEMLNCPIYNNTYPKGKDPKPERTIRWLILLARQLQNVSQTELTEFLIEQMQPSWLQTKIHKWIYHAGVGIIATFIVWLIIVSCLCISGQSDKLVNWFLLGPAIGFYSAFQKEIKPIETLKLSWKNALSGFTSVMIPMLKFWAITIISTMVISELYFLVSEPTTISRFIISVKVIFLVSLIISILAISSTLMLSLVNALGIGLRGTALSKQQRITPNQGMWQSLRNVFSFALIGILSFSLISIGIRWLLSLIFSLIGLRTTPITTWLVLALVLGLSVGLYPGLACIQHLSLRVVLWKLNYIPRNYALFLKYATKRKFLQEVGGRYQFIHPLLQKHFYTLYYKNTFNG